MYSLTRRAWLAGCTALTLAAARRAQADYVKPVDIIIGHGPPVAPVRPVVEIYFGEIVTDRYRWMEAQGPEFETYIRAQGDYAAAMLAKIPGRAALNAAISRCTGAVAEILRLQTAGAQIFTEIRPAGANTSKLYVRTGESGADRLLIDPDATAPPGEHQELDWWQASPDGAHVVFGMSRGGSEDSTLRVLETATGALLPEAITRTNWASPSWLPDGSGFFYNRLQDVSPESVTYEENSCCWLHLLQTDATADRAVLGPGLDAAIRPQPIDTPNVYATPGSDILIGVLASGVRNELTLYTATLAAKPGWKLLCTPSDGVTNFAVRGAEIFLLTHAHAPHGRVLKLTGAHLANAVEVVPQSEAVIRDIAAAQDGLYIVDLQNGSAGLRRLAPNGGLTRLALPFPGGIDPDAFHADTQHDGAWFALESWVRPRMVCRAGADGVTPTALLTPPPLDVSAYVAEEVFVPARDNARIPLSIISRKGLKHDGSAPLLLEAYGAYGITLDPSFLARWLPFLDQGGVFAVAHVRGGGELGEDWRLDGQKSEKFHTWQDMEDCATHLIAARYTSRRRLAIMGGSAGGITVGRLLTERPELAAVVISRVGVCNATRSEFSPNGPPNIPEFGTVRTEAGFRALLAMDAYQHVHDGAQYPATLLTTGLHDPRVSPWEPAKMTARLQAASSSKNPVLLRVEADAGHGIGSTRAQSDAETADITAFTLWRTGEKRYQPG